MKKASKDILVTVIVIAYTFMTATLFVEIQDTKERMRIAEERIDKLTIRPFVTPITYTLEGHCSNCGADQTFTLNYGEMYDADLHKCKNCGCTGKLKAYSGFTVYLSVEHSTNDNRNTGRISETRGADFRDTHTRSSVGIHADNALQESSPIQSFNIQIRGANSASGE